MGRHIRARSVRYQPADEDSVAGRHFRGDRLNLTPFGILAEQITDARLTQVSSDLEVTLLVRARQE